MKPSNLKLNTSNQGKYEEFQRLFKKWGCILEATHFDLKEIDADPIKVVSHKATLLNNILVEDTSLDVEGASVGVNIRWLLKHLKEYIGRKAVWTVLLAIRQEDTIFIYKGVVNGKIGEPAGNNGFGFDFFFVPEGATQTLAESKPDIFNARVKAVEALINQEVWTTHPIIENWTGPWQDS